MNQRQHFSVLIMFFINTAVLNQGGNTWWHSIIWSYGQHSLLHLNCNHCQNYWDTLHRVVYIKSSLPYNIESSIFLHSLLADPNIAWWVRGRYGMLKHSLTFMSKKVWFQHIKMNANTVKLMHHFCVNLPTIFWWAL